MKAILNLSVEIDLSQIICDDSIEALKMFTGADSKEGVGAFYLEKIASSITANKDLSLPHIKYNLGGNIVPTENLFSEAVAESTDEYFDIDEPVNDAQDYPLIDEGEAEVQSNNEDATNLFVDKIIHFMESVSINKGLPKAIRVSAEHYDFACVNKEGVGMSSLAGLPVYRDTELQAVAEIVYEPYGAIGETESEYLRTMSQTL